MGMPKLALALCALGAAACVTTSTTSTTWESPSGARPPLPDRPGRVEWVRETVTHQQGNPAGGAAVGAVVGGLLGHAVTGDPAGTLVGAATGAVAGASASQGSAETRTYEMAVRYDDGAFATYIFHGGCPFRPGEKVVWTPQGFRRGHIPPPPSAPPPGPPPVPPPPPS